MKTVTKRQFTKRQLTALILLGVSLLLLAAAIILGVIKSNQKPSSSKKDPPEIIEGEAVSGGYPVAYPVMKETDIQLIEITADGKTYGLFRPEANKSLELYYIDENGKEQYYYPGIISEDSSFVYDSLYAIEPDDGFGTIPKLSYLLMSIQNAYFSERISLSDDPEEREKQLAVYGLSDGKYSVIEFGFNQTVTDEDGKVVKDENGNPVTERKKHTVKIGKKDITGAGYYFSVDNRDYVYASSTKYYDYALSGFASFINSTLISAGLPSDNGFGPYLTQGYYQWKPEVNRTEGAEVTEGSKVVIYTDVLSIPTERSESLDYALSGYSQLEIDLSEEYYKELAEVLVGLGVGKYGTDTAPDGNIRASVVLKASAGHLLDFSKSESLSYSYSISEIVSVFTDEGEKFDTGLSVGANIGASNRIKVRYSATLDGKTESTFAVLDLSSALLPDAARNALMAASVGELSAPVEFDIVYKAEDGTPSRFGQYKITEIHYIYDSEGKEINKVTSSSIVSYKYSFIVDGKVQYEDNFELNLGMADGETDEKIKNALLGKSVGKNLDITVDKHTSYFEILNAFEEYRIARIDRFITEKLVSAFKFQNSSQRDPYYGESLYENLMDNKYSLYGINYTSCQGVVKLLGGISEDGSSNTAAGLSGSETVALGITPENMEKYGLYAHHVYFVLPRGITSYIPDTEEGNDDALSDYSFYDTIGFNLYISDPDPVTGERYIGSDMYDIVAKIDGEDFFFLDSGFAEFWARRNIILMDVKNIDSMKVELGYADMYGTYNFDLGFDSDDALTVKVTPEGECTPNALTEYMQKNGRDFLSLEELFKYTYPDDPEADEYEPESVGSTYFRELLMLIYTTEYEDTLTAAEQAEARALNKRLMRMELKVKSSSYKYVYEFYALDATRVMVSIHKENMSGDVVISPVSDFSISTFAFKKIAKNGFFDLLDAKKIDPEVGYPD